MGFWIYVTLMDLVVPFTFLGFGRYFIKKAPGKVNGVFGYRTPMSMKNKDTWEFAHHYCGKIWYICGWITLPVTVMGMCCVLGKDADTVGNVGGIIMGVQMVLLIGSIIPTEIALRKTFDKNGRRKVLR